MNTGAPRLDLQLKSAQTLIMTPQLREAIGLLQLSNLELAGYLENEIAENPFLEKAEGSPDPDNEPAEAAPETETPDTMEDNFSEGFDTGSSMATVGAGGSSSFEDDDRSFDERLAHEKTLHDHLTEQLSTLTSDAAARAIGAALIDRLDEAGYLREAPEDIAAQLGCAPEKVKSMLERMKQFDPTGIFAADLPECLALQLREKNRLDPVMEIFLANLDKVAQADMKGLARACRVEEEDVRDMIREIRALNPKPAANFDHIVVQTALPDVVMRPIPKHLGGGWRVELNAETLPRVLVNNDYAAIVGNEKLAGDDKKYLSNRLASAHWLVKALDQRAQTILKVASSIIEHQDGFFLFGVEFLKPLTLKDIAEEVGVHESTVSRVTIGKYIGTPRGLFELKYFFDSGVSGSGGTEVAAEAVKAKIKAMIEAEHVDNVLSDEDIAEKLGKEGIAIARRTVAKYREAAGIATSSLRRRIARNKG